MERFQKPGDVYYRQTIHRPFINKEHLVVNFDEPEPTFRTNEPEIKPEISESNQYTMYHDLDIPVEDQRLVASPAYVDYNVPKYRYEYVPVIQDDCVPTCGGNNGSAMTAEKAARLRRWYGNGAQDWANVLDHFGGKYGYETFDGSMLHDPKADFEFLRNDEIDAYLGKKKGKKNNYLPHDYDFDAYENDQDGSWEYKYKKHHRGHKKHGYDCNHAHYHKLSACLH